MTNYSIHKLQPANAHLTEQLRAYAYDVIGACQVVHRDMGPFLNEYMHFVDFLVRNDKKTGLPKIFNFWEEEEARPLHLLQRNLIMDRRFRREQRQQLWNYMRLTSTRIGILYNFAPVKDECERYYLDATTGMMYAF